MAEKMIVVDMQNDFHEPSRPAALDMDDKAWQELEEALTKHDYPSYIRESY